MKTWRAASTTEPFVYPNSGFSTWGKGKREHLKHIGEGICDIGCGKYLEVHEQVQELEDIADSFPALGWETLLVSRVLQGHDDQRIEEATEHEEVVDE